ncbi:hypothetical protein CEXT_193501 [Caerostris extrusa]|uniref:Uncharacterized protein n=1 Tax=Caerostris extrusa TaxID=172846 RepID=A0AAV4PC74_CAEEX|nr:hypothetical protein CEXT_193501 [Caerostris extrusa]
MDLRKVSPIAIKTRSHPICGNASLTTVLLKSRHLPFGCALPDYEGNEKRNVTCVKKFGGKTHESSLCDLSSKPHSEQNCSNSDCNVLKRFRL